LDVIFVGKTCLRITFNLEKERQRENLKENYFPISGTKRVWELVVFSSQSDVFLLPSQKNGI